MEKKRGRPRKNTSINCDYTSQKMDISASSGGVFADKLPASPNGPNRPPRIPLHAGLNLHVPSELLDKQTYAYRWFAESSLKGGRIEVAKGAYWEHVADSKGQNYKRPSATDTMYLMKLELKYWKEDQEIKRRKVRLTMEKEAQIGENEYAPHPKGYPEGGHSSITRTVG